MTERVEIIIFEPGEGRAFRRAIEQIDEQIERALLIPGLALREGQYQARSAAQAQEHVLRTLLRLNYPQYFDEEGNFHMVIGRATFGEGGHVQDVRMQAWNRLSDLLQERTGLRPGQPASGVTEAGLQSLVREIEKAGGTLEASDVTLVERAARQAKFFEEQVTDEIKDEDKDEPTS
jgi:hypothetical protein